jgi:hypothetical protein
MKDFIEHLTKSNNKFNNMEDQNWNKTMAVELTNYALQHPESLVDNQVSDATIANFLEEKYNTSKKENNNGD